MGVKERIAVAGAQGLILGALFVGCAASADNDAGDSPPVSPEVTVAIFSGREDPTFDLSEDARRQLGQRLGEIEPGLVESTPTSETLGFRGFVVTNDDSAEYYVLPDMISRVAGDEVSVAAEGAGDVYRIIWDDISDQFDQTLIDEVPHPQE